jgi:hypothetical protein
LLAVYHLARLLAAALLAFSLLRFLETTLGEGENRALIYALALLGSGLGWLAFPFGAVVSDLWVAETYPFLSSFANPHFPLGLALALWLLVISLNAPGQSLKAGLWTALLSLVLAITAPFGVVLVLMILGGLFGLEVIRGLRRSSPALAGNGGDTPPANAPGWLAPPISGLLQQVFWVTLGGGPVVLYYLVVANLDPVLGGWNAQNLTPSPPPWDLAISLSPALIFAGMGAWAFARGQTSRGRLFLVWAGFGLALLYAPLSLQRRFMMGLYIPVVGLAAVGLDQLASKSPEKWGRRAPRLVLFWSLPTNLLLLFLAIYGIQTHNPLYYLTRGEHQAFGWIETNTPQRALILAAPDTGMYIPAHTGRRVIYGHPFETVNAQDEEAAVTAFFQESGGTSPEAFLEARGVEYVFYGPRERLLGDLPEIPQLQQVYSQAGVSIYQVGAR